MTKDDDLPAGKSEEKPMVAPDMAKLPPLMDRSAEQQSSPALKLYVVYPGNPQEPPFYFSNTPNVMLVAAKSEREARSLAFNEAGHAAWRDDEKVSVDEYTPRAPMVLTRNLRS